MLWPFADARRLLPIAAIVAPATLSVTFDHLPPSNASHFVPLPAFASLKFADFSHDANDDNIISYLRPSVEATRIAQAVAFAGSILPVAPPAVNATWEVTISVPRLGCEHVNATLLSAIKDNIADVMGPLLEGSRDKSIYGEEGDKYSQRAYIFFAYMFSYMSWTGIAHSRADALAAQMPFDTNSYPSQPNATEMAATALELGLGWNRNDHDLLFVAALPRSMVREPPVFEPLAAIFEKEWNMPATIGARKAMDWAFEEATVLRCEYVASEYTLRFSYHGSSQEQDIHVSRRADLVPNVAFTDYSSSSLDTGCFDLRREHINTTECDLGIKGLYKWSYRAMADLFADMLVGAASPPGGQNDERTGALLPHPDPSNDRTYSFSSQVFYTSLAETTELLPMGKPEESTQGFIADRNATLALDEVYSLSRASSRSAPRMNLKEAIEELFFNITMSMASSPKFAYNISAPNAPENVTVTVNKMGNIYTYSSEKLWLAYGLAIAITVLNVCLGLLAMFRTGASFTLNFSTIVRAAKNADVSVETDELTLSGRDPLPEGWKKAVFTMRNPSAGLEGKRLEKGDYDSLDQSVEEGQRGREGDAEEVGDGNGDERRLSWESRGEEQSQLAERRGREGSVHIHSDGPREDDQLVRS
jgi:hypothetical protein